MSNDDSDDDFHFTNMLGSPARELVRNSCLRNSEDDRRAARWIARVLRELGMETSGDRSTNIYFCRQDILVGINMAHPRRSTVFVWPCKNRVCPGCTRWRVGGQLTRRLEPLRDVSKSGDQLFDVTFTHHDRPGESCKEAWERLHDAIKRRVRLPSFKRVVLGWMLRIEVTWRPGGWFHVHAHGVVVAVAGTTPVDLKALWRGASGTKVIRTMSVRPLAPSRVGNWLLYLAKPMKLSRRGWMEFMRDVPTGHAVIAGGVLRSKLLPKDAALLKADDLGRERVPLSLIKRWAEDGHELAVAVLEGIRPSLRRMGITDGSKALGSDVGPSAGSEHRADTHGKVRRAGTGASPAPSRAGTAKSRRPRRRSR